MRVEINLDPKLVREIDRLVGKRKRSAFIVETLRRTLDDERRRKALLDAIGSAPEYGADWGMSAAKWVRAQRRAESA
jgi:Arc/MetJ-type ribon-helix-helix transcriptional regulator